MATCSTSCMCVRGDLLIFFKLDAPKTVVVILRISCTFLLPGRCKGDRICAELI